MDGENEDDGARDKDVVVIARQKVWVPRLARRDTTDSELEACLDIVDAEEPKDAAANTKVLREQWRKKRHVKTNAPFFAALRAAAVRRSFLSRIKTLRHDKVYRKLCRKRKGVLDMAVGEDLRARLAAEPCARDLDELAAWLFMLPELIPLEELDALLKRWRKPGPEESNGDPGRGQKQGSRREDHLDPDERERMSIMRRKSRFEGELTPREWECLSHMQWNEDVPILIDRSNQDAVEWHLSPETPSRESRPSRHPPFLWGRRLVFSIPMSLLGAGGGVSGSAARSLNEAADKLGRRPHSRESPRRLILDALGPAACWARMVDLAFEAEREWRSSAAACRRNKAAAMKAERDRDEAAASSGGPGAAMFRLKVSSRDDLLASVGRFFRRQRAKRRICTVAGRPGSGPRSGDAADMLLRIAAVERAVEQSNRSGGEVSTIKWKDGVKTSIFDHIPDRAAADPSQQFTPEDVEEWLCRRLENLDLEPGEVENIAAAFRQNFGKSAARR